MAATAEKEEYVFSRNIEILTNKPSNYLNSIFVIFFACHCSLLLCVIKAFNKRQSFQQCVQISSIIFRNK